MNFLIMMDQMPNTKVFLKINWKSKYHQVQICPLKQRSKHMKGCMFYGS